MNKIWIVLLAFVVVMAAALVVGFVWLRDATQTVLSPIQSAGSRIDGLSTQVSSVLNPTPTIIPDPVTIIHEVRSLARLETIQYSVEKVITAETNQNFFGALFGDRLLFVAHGVVIAGVDLGKLEADDLWVEGGALYVRLPETEIFVSTLDNDKSYVYDRETGLLSRGNTDLETAARQAAENEITQAALDDGILAQAQQNAEVFLERLLNDLGYQTVVFVSQDVQRPGAAQSPVPGTAPAVESTPSPALTPAP